jgi:hypothetical protein
MQTQQVTLTILVEWTSRFIFGDGVRGRSKSMTSGKQHFRSRNSSGFYFGNNTTGMPTTDWWSWNGTIGNDWATTDG